MSTTNKATTSSSSSSSTTTTQYPLNYTNAQSYQEYYQQYMQYIYSMSTMYNYTGAYTGAVAGSMPTQTNQAYNAAAYAAYQKAQDSATIPPPPPQLDTKVEQVNINLNADNNEIATVAQSQQQQQQQPQQQQMGFVNKTAPIKINLKFHQQPKKLQNLDMSLESPVTEHAPKRKSRFDIGPANGTKKQAPIQSEVKKSELVEKKQEIVNDIVSDINKWPAKLKNYCAKVYQSYSSVKIVSEQQVTNYLQARITEVFKIRPDLNIDWDLEKIPDITQIRKLNGISDLMSNKVTPTVNIQKPDETQKTVLNESVKFNKRAKSPQRVTYKQRSRSRSSSKESIKILSTANKRSRSHSSSSSTTSSTSSSTSTNASSKRFNTRIKQQPKIVSSKIQRKTSSSDSVDKDYDSDSMVVDEIHENDDENENVEFIPITAKKNKLNNKNAKNKKNSMTFFGQVDNKRLENRAQRFNAQQNKTPEVKRKLHRSIFQLEKEQHATALHEIVLTGTCQDLEKEYLRLTCAPEASNVRPLNVLKKSLQYVLEKYAKSNDYRYICDQLKAIRQDLTVQMIRNEFTIEVYETHARIAITKGDREELNQCQSQLLSLYSLNSGKIHKNATEFVGYRLLYYILTRSYKDLNQVIREIERKYKTDSYLKHLLNLCNAWQISNYVKFFRLYKKSNEMSKFLIDLFIERERKLALKMIIKSYRPNIKLDIVKELLAYESINKCKEDLTSYGLIINTETNTNSDNNNKIELVLDCKISNLQN